MSRTTPSKEISQKSPGMKISVVGLAQKRKMVICCASPFISKGEKAWQGTLEYTDTTYPH